MTKYNVAQQSFLYCCQLTHFLLSYFLFNNMYDFFIKTFKKKGVFFQMRFCNLTFQKRDKIRNIPFKSQMLGSQTSSYLDLFIFLSHIQCSKAHLIFS